MPETTEREFPCEQCGAELKFQPGAVVLKCPYCTHENAIPQLAAEIEEIDYHAAIADLANHSDTIEVQTVKCQGCAGEYTRQHSVTSDECPYCGTPIVTTGGSTRLMRPKSLLPFLITSEQGMELFRKWIVSLWFAPNALKRYARNEGKLSGMYVPYWTYDSNTISHYSGQRGDDYYVSQTYTTTENGRTVTRTRQVKKTRWRWVSGTVHVNFDDVLVLASTSLPKKYADALEPWDLQNLTPYQDAYLAGMRAESYHLNVEQGFDVAKGIMDEQIRAAIRRDIGGDHQRIHDVSTQHRDLTFKHILLPIWISAYRYMEKVFRFLVNGRTGEVQGERPYSWIKITLFVLTILAAIGGIVALVASGKG